MSTPLKVDNTWASAFRSCFRKGQYRHELMLAPIEKAAPLNFGAAIHAGAAEYNRQLAKHVDPKEAAQAAILVCLKSWDEKSEMGEKEWRTPDRAVDILTKLFQQKLPTAVIAPSGEPVVEADFAYPLLSVNDSDRVRGKLKEAGYDDLLYTGIIDLLVQDGERKIVVDWKTTSWLQGDTRKGESKSISNYWWQQFSLHAATTGYLWGASHFVPDKIHGVGIYALGANASTTVFGYQIYDKTPEQVEEWRVNTIALVEEFLDAKLRGYFKQNPDNCFAYMKQCPYFNLCKAPASRRETLYGLYEKNEWNPLEARAKEAARLDE